ncbi:selenocysteine-specific translation elongation factor [Limnoglobus roseus]|uniref:Selenocysteine-specific elongation factor n=1 Tax=Limnoglobus roseus TaxID=2598579 RepID=A0A5C1AIP2_9BACT|nr:selenocysteine-specific translation elongation factor [Limnoglobus roseus]QEL18113.1 selenocysteine-specific translation elongation factor [Limnoglobus roseus]
MRDLILGTAGHIDHGKTALVKALTGIDCDRLPEEKRRGITIDIGFAQLSLGGFDLGVVDVPGHEKFVKNMLAGATGIDLALLVVAADDAVMPQTREHLAILNALGVERGVIALTKADLVDDTARELAILDVRELVRGSFLQDAPIIPTSAVAGTGVRELKAAIAAACEKLPPRPDAGWFRLAIDRSFVVQGHGTVVTGSATAGSVRVGDELDWHKGDGTSERVRVRGLNRHNQSTDELHRGQRAALNLAGVPHDAVQRGQELATPGILVPSKVLTVRLQNLTLPERPLKHRLPVRLHVGTADVPATLSLLDTNLVRPGEWVFAQLFLDESVTAVWGQPFVLRDSSAEHTLGGGQVLQPTGKKLRRRHVESLERVEQLATDEPLHRTTAAAWFAGFQGFEANDLVRMAALPCSEIEPTILKLLADDALVEMTLGLNRKHFLHRDRVRELGELILDVLRDLHAAHPLHTNHARPMVLARLDYVGNESLVQAVTDRMIGSKQIVGDSKRIARADFKPRLSVNQRKLKDKIVDDHRRGGCSPPDPASFANAAGGNAGALKEIFEVAVAEGHLVRIAADFFLHADEEAKARQVVADGLRTSEGLTLAEIRDLLGTTRKYAVPLCEYLDRAGVTRRQGDLRMLAGQTAE